MADLGRVPDCTEPGGDAAAKEAAEAAAAAKEAEEAAKKAKEAEEEGADPMALMLMQKAAEAAKAKAEKEKVRQSD